MRAPVSLLVVLAWRSTPTTAAAVLAAPIRFYAYPDTALDFSHLLTCPGAAELINSARGEGLQEVHVYAALGNHAQRVLDPKDADVFYLPVMEFLSLRVGRCNGADHAQRMASALGSLQQSTYFRRRGGRDHFWVSSKSHIYGPDMAGTPLAHLNRSAIGMHRRMLPLSKALRATIVGRMKAFGRVDPKPAISAVGRCTFDVGHQPNQEALRIFDTASHFAPRRHLVYFAGSFNVCCTGKAIRCHLAKLLVPTDGDPDVFFAPSGRGNDRGSCHERALDEVARKRNVSSDAIAASYAAIAGGSSGNRYVEMAHAMKASTFCLAPAGDICTSSRFVSAIAAGCIPVVLCNRLRPPFHESVDYSQFVVYYDTDKLARDPMGLLTTLRAMKASKVRRMQAALLDAREKILFQVSGGRTAASNLLVEVRACMK